VQDIQRGELAVLGFSLAEGEEMLDQLGIPVEVVVEVDLL
jgi:hypothetical protein